MSMDLEIGWETVPDVALSEQWPALGGIEWHFLCPCGSILQGTMNTRRGG